jgi:hypothetical protein
MRYTPCCLTREREGSQAGGLTAIQPPACLQAQATRFRTPEDSRRWLEPLLPLQKVDSAWGNIMHSYGIIKTTAAGVRTVQWMLFADAHSAMAYALPLARGCLLEIWNQGKCIAFVDELPASLRAA